MRKLAVAAVVASATLLAGRSVAQQACPCVPVTHVWIAEPCDSWSCAASAVSLADGKDVVPMPTTSSDFGWVVLHRVTSGAAIASPNTFKVDGFDTLADGVDHFNATDHDLQPMLLTAPDGKVLVVARLEPEKPRSHAVRH
jgi:hypothetical protein